MAKSKAVNPWRVGALAFAVSLAFNQSAWGVLPTGAQVVSGAAQIGTVGKTMTVTNTPSAIINWQSFSIGAGEAVRFMQQSAASTVLNRVVGGQMSEIMGRLTSNGQVFLINPAGILVGAGAVIDTASFFVSTLQMLDRDFLAGKLKFEGDASSGKITNHGWIRTGFGGHAVLVAPKIENGGIIEAPGGQILLAAGQKITLSSLDLGGLSFEVQAPTDSALNLGQLIADGGVVKVFAGSLKHSGDIRANALTRDAAGEIVLRGKGDVELAAGSSTVANGRTGGTIRIESETGTARVEGNVSATGSTGAGGGIDVLGEKVVAKGNATLDASGASAGGTIRVGGDWQGANPEVKNAQNAFIGSGVTIKADATDRGDGGKIVVWSDGDTRFVGSLSAQGGPNGGNGGNAEVSGKGDLLFIGGANLGAPRGVAGTLLLDPLDLFVDAVGGLNPSIIDEATDFPNHAVTVSPATLAGIAGNVTLYASRDMRFNSAITLAGAGQGLAASAGRDMQIGTGGTGIITNGGAVSLTAARNMTTFGPSPIATAGGNVSLTAQSLSVGNMTVAAGAGAVNVSSSAGNLSLGAVSSSGSVAMTSTGGGISLAAGANITSTGAVNLTSSSSIAARQVFTNGGAFTANATGGSFSNSSSTIDTRPGQAGLLGGAVSVTSSPSSVAAGVIQAGNANVGLSGTSVSNPFITTTGNVNLSASNGSISNVTVNDAANVTATSSNSSGSTSISITSTTVASLPLNATSISATSGSAGGATVTLTADKGVNVGTVAASAPSFPTYFSGEAVQFNGITESVTINGQNGPIQAMSAASQVTATNVTLQTNPGAGGGIGNAATALRVSNARNFTFRPNGEFNVLLNGSGPNVLDARLGVAATGQTYTGTLAKTGQIALSASATDATVTVSNFSVTSGFDDLVFNTAPSISLSSPNGSLVVTNASFPTGDQTGRIQPFTCCTPTIRQLPVSFSAGSNAGNNLTVTNYVRSSGVLADSTSFTASNGSVTLGAVNAGSDAVTVSAATDVNIDTSLVTTGNVTINAATGGADNGIVSIDGLGINTAGGSGSVTINALSLVAGQGEVRAGTDSVPLEITAGGAITISARTIGNSTGFGNPLDFAGPSVTLNTNSTAVGTGTAIGSASGPVVANTATLTINAAGCSTSSTLCTGSFRGGTFNVSTGNQPLQNLTIVADPTLVGGGGLAQVSSNGETYVFTSGGGNFTTSPIVSTGPGGQFLNGGFTFTSLRGNLTLGNIDLSATNGNFNFRTNGSLANLSQVGLDSIDLGTGFLTLAADGNVSLQAINARGMSVTNATTSLGSGRSDVGGTNRDGVTSFTTNGNAISDTGNGGGTFSVTSRGAVNTGALDVSGVNFQAMQTGLNTGTIGSTLRPATSVILSTNFSGAGGDVTTGSVEANSFTVNARGNVTTGPVEANSVTVSAVGNISVGGGTGTINAANTGAGSVDLSTLDSGGTITTGAINAANVTLTADGLVTINGAINAAVVAPNNVRLNSSGGTIVINGSVDANSLRSGTNSNTSCCSEPGSISITGAVGGNVPGNEIYLSAGSVSIGGAVTVAPAGFGSVNLYANNGAGTGLTVNGAITGGIATSFDLRSSSTSTPVTVNGAITGGDQSNIYVYSGATTPFGFSSMDAGPNGVITIDSAAGINQTLAGAGGGLTGGYVALYANNVASTIQGPAAALNLRGARTLTLETGGSVNIDRTDGANPIPPLDNLDITRSDSTAVFSLTGFAPGQSAAVTNVPGGVSVASNTPDGTLMRFRYRNTDGTNSTITGTGINTKFGDAILISDAGTVNSGAIDTTDISVGPGGAYVELRAGGAGSVNVSGAVNAGSGTVYIEGPSVGGAGAVSSTTQVLVTASAGDIGSAVTPLAVATPSVQLFSAGEVYANLSGTTVLSASGDTGFTITSDTALTNVGLTTRGDRAGPVSLLSVPGQTFGFIRNGAAVDITTVSSTVPLSSLGFSVTNGNLRLVGTGGPLTSIAADNFTLFTTGNLSLDGTGPRLVVSNGSSQDFAAGGNLNLTGAATLTSGGDQKFRASGDVVVQAQGGDIVLTGADQQFGNPFAPPQDVKLLAGAAAGESVTASASNSQLFTANRDIMLTGGTDTSTSVSAMLNGPGAQSFSAGRDIALSGNIGNQSSVTVGLVGNGNQEFSAGRDIAISGNAGDQSSVTVSLAGNGNQTFGTTAGSIILDAGTGNQAAITVSATGAGAQEFRARGDINLLAGGTLGGNADAAVSVTKSGSDNQLLFAEGAIRLNVDGLGVIRGAGDGGSVTISNTGAGTQTIGDPLTSGGNYATDSLTLQGGGGQNSFALVEANGRQLIRPIVAVNVLGGAGDGSYARIRGNLATSSAATRTNSSQVIGHDFSFDGSGCCSFPDQLDTIKVAAGTGLNAYGEISSAGSQRLRATTSMGVLGSTADGGFGRVSGLSQYLNVGDMAGAADRGVRAGTGDGADAIIEATGTNADIPLFENKLQSISAGNLLLQGQGVAGIAAAAARITSGGRQEIFASTTQLLAGPGSGSEARIFSAATDTSTFSSGLAQRLSLGNLTLTGGGAVGASPTTARAEIISLGSQNISGSSITLNGGIGQDSWARIESTSTQSMSSSGSLTLRGGGAIGTPSAGVATPGAVALVRSLSGGQTLSGTITLQGGIGTAGGAATDASAMIVNTAGTQTVSGNVTINSGADYAPAGIVNLAGADAQTFSSGSISIGTTTGANGLDAPIGGGHYAGVFQLGTGTQTLNGSSIAVDNQFAPGQIGIVASGAQSLGRGGNAISVQNSSAAGIARISAGTTQTVIAGNVTVTSSGTAGEAKITAAGAQTFTNSNVMLVEVSAGGGTASIANAAGDQSIVTSGGLRVQNSAGSGTASIVSPAAQTVTAAFVDVNTGATSTGSALLSATGNQSIHTTNGTVGAAGGKGSLSVVAAGSGIAKIQSDAGQLLEIDYPEVMQQSQFGTRDGRVTVGSAGTTGTSMIKAVNQDIFARSIAVRGGTQPGTIALAAGKGATLPSASIIATSVQNISLLASAAGPATGVAVAGGAGGSALIDPSTQTILSNGLISVMGGSAGTDVIGGIVGTGTQTILVTNSSGANGILVQGGAGTNADGRIATAGAQTITVTTPALSARSMQVSGGTGLGADGQVTAGGNQTIAVTTSSAFGGILVEGGGATNAIGEIASSGNQSITVTMTTASPTPVALPGLQIQGGNGNGAIGQVSATGSQYVFVSTVAPGASDISILGGGGIDAFGQVSAASMLIGTTGGITLTPGTGANADSTLTAGQVIPYGCGVGFTCAFPVLPGNFRTNGIADFGGAPQTVQVDLATFTGQFPFSSQESPFVSPIESTTLLLWNTAGWWLEPGEEDREVRLGRLLPVCR